jgi:hypothetical protein
MSHGLKTGRPVPGIFLAGRDGITTGIPQAPWSGVPSDGTVDPGLFRQPPGAFVP